MKHDLTRARELVKESGYDGRPVVVVHVTDRVHMNAAAIVTRQRLESIGFRVHPQADGWSTNLVVRARKEAPDKGGWNLLSHVWLPRTSSIPPSTLAYRARARAPGSAGRHPQLEKLITDWVRATDQTKRKQLADEVSEGRPQRRCVRAVGEWFQPTAYRKSVQGVLKFRRAGVLECEDHVGAISQNRPSPCLLPKRGEGFRSLAPIGDAGQGEGPSS